MSKKSKLKAELEHAILIHSKEPLADRDHTVLTVLKTLVFLVENTKEPNPKKCIAKLKPKKKIGRE